MRRLVVLAAVSVATLAVAVGVDSTSAGAVRGNPATSITVVRPVNTAGHPRAGFAVQAEPTGGVNCNFPDPAPSAVSPNIEQCFPSAEYAAACWKAAAAHKVLCMRNPRVRKLVRIPRHGPFAPTPLAPARDRAPLAMVLANGDVCTFRLGGAVGPRAGHPRWTATYFCHSGKMVWMRPGAHHYGINERFDSWIAIVADTTGPIFARHLLRAWFVGTYHGG